MDGNSRATRETTLREQVDELVERVHALEVAKDGLVLRVAELEGEVLRESPCKEPPPCSD